MPLAGRRLVLAALCSVACALRWDGPLATPAGIIEQPGWNPKPTPPPASKWDVLDPLHLFDRQILVRTCGYISAVSSLYLTCAEGYICATNSRNNVAACCETGTYFSECTIPTTCVASTDMSVSCTDDACTFNNFIQKCTLPGSTQCFTWYYHYQTATPSEVGCSNIAFTEDVYLTYRGEYSGSVSISAQASANTIDSQSAVPVITRHTTVALSTQTHDAKPQATTIIIKHDSGSSTNVGAIVGGVVGGIAGIAIIIGLILFFLWRKKRNDKKKKKEETAAAAAAAASNQHYHGGPGPNGPNGNYNQGYDPNMGPPQMGQTSPYYSVGSGYSSVPQQTMEHQGQYNYYDPNYVAYLNASGAAKSQAYSSPTGGLSHGTSPDMSMAKTASPHQEPQEMHAADGVPSMRNSHGDTIHEAP